MIKSAVKITAAFGLRECPKVVELLAHEDLDVRQQALLVLCEVFGRPDRIATALRAGAVPDLLRLASDPRGGSSQNYTLRRLWEPRRKTSRCRHVLEGRRGVFK